MYGYKINIKGLPETVFACSTTVDDYNWKNANDNRTIEIAVCKSESVTSIINNKTYSLCGSHLICVAGNEERYCCCDSGVQFELTTVAVRFDEINISSGELSYKDASDNSCFLLPSFLEDAYPSQEIIRLINKYIKHNTLGRSYDKAQCVSIWFNILCYLDKYTRTLLCKQETYFDNFYVKKINHIIDKKYAENISLTKIAEEFGVSMSYLSSTYSSMTGQSFKKSLLTKRMIAAKELILTTSLPLADIAVMVGICDDAYLRKCFKRFYGVSVSEFKKINKGLTLYHKKPLRKQN